MSHTSPFATLGIAPTLDGSAIKRAYFASLKLYPPHLDAAAFQRVRAAYEQLSNPSLLAVAYLSEPVDAKAELGAYAELDAQLRAAGQASSDRNSAEQGVNAMIDALSGLSWSEALARFSG